MNPQVHRGALLEADGGEFLDAHDQVALVHRRHEGLADLGVDQARCQQHRQRSRADNALPAQTPRERRCV